MKPRDRDIAADIRVTERALDSQRTGRYAMLLLDIALMQTQCDCATCTEQRIFEESR